MKSWVQNCHQGSFMGSLAQTGRHRVCSLDACPLGERAQLGSASFAPV